MQGRIEIKDRKLIVEIPFDQEYAEVVVLGSLEKAKQISQQFIMKEAIEKMQKKERSALIKPGVMQ